MPSHLPVRVSIAFCLLLLVHPAVADDPLPSGDAQVDKAVVPLPIATINVKQVLDQHAGFNQGIERIKSEIAEMEKGFRSRIEELEAKKKKWSQENPDAQSNSNRELLRSEAELQMSVALKQREFLEREASLYAAVYQEIQDAVAKLARKHKTQIVLRDHTIYTQQLDQLQDSLAVLFQKGTDLTDEVVRTVNASERATGDVERDKATSSRRKETFGVALVDLGKVISAHRPHHERLTALEDQERDREKDIAARQTKLGAMETRLKLLLESSKDYQELANAYAQERAELVVEQKANEQLSESHTTTANDQTVEDVKQAIATFARKNGIDLVVTFDSSPIDPKDRVVLLSGLARPIVFQEGLDITEDVIRALGDGQASNEAPDAQRSDARTDFAVKVAVIDMAVAFKENGRLTVQMEKLQQEVAEFQRYLQDRNNALEDLKSLLNALEEGTDVHRDTAKQLARETAEVKVEIALKEEELENKQAQCYARTYKDVRAIVSRLARARGIRLVIRFDSTPMDSDDRKSILRTVNRSVVHHDEVDITAEVIRQAKAESSVELR